MTKTDKNVDRIVMAVTDTLNAANAEESFTLADLSEALYILLASAAEMVERSSGLSGTRYIHEIAAGAHQLLAYKEKENEH